MDGLIISNSIILQDIFQLYLQLAEKVQNLHSNKKFINIDALERLFSQLYWKRRELDDLYMSNMITEFNEKAVIKAIREEYKAKGIKLKTAHKIPISIQTEMVKIRYQRYMLVPKNAEDAKRLMELEGKRSVFPLDIALGVSELPHNMTVRAMLKVSKIAQAASSYKEASKILAEDHGISLDPATIMAVTNHIGHLAFANETAQADECYNNLISGKISFPEKRKDGILYIEMDGAFVNTREKSEKFDSSWRENKLGVVFSSDNKQIVQKRKEDSKREILLDGTERKRFLLTKKHYTAYVGSVDEFKKLLFNCAILGGYGNYKETVIISDGATWIRNVKDELFCDAQQILDYFHLTEKVCHFARGYFKINIVNSTNTKHKNNNINIEENANYIKYKEWKDEVCLKILKSKIDDVLSDITKKEKQLRVKNNKLSTYIYNNIQTTDYATYLKKGYEIGSGAIESANKTILQRRLDGPGMRWYAESAQNMVTLRAKMESGKWFDDVVVPVNKFYKIPEKEHIF